MIAVRVDDSLSAHHRRQGFESFERFKDSPFDQKVRDLPG
jgi:hypothetical protein